MDIIRLDYEAGIRSCNKGGFNIWSRDFYEYRIPFILCLPIRWLGKPKKFLASDTKSHHSSLSCATTRHSILRFKIWYNLNTSFIKNDLPLINIRFHKNRSTCPVITQRTTLKNLQTANEVGMSTESIDLTFMRTLALRNRSRLKDLKVCDTTGGKRTSCAVTLEYRFRLKMSTVPFFQLI